MQTLAHVWMCIWALQGFSLHLPVTGPLTLSPVFLSGTQKNAAAIATESKGRPGPGLSPLERPDWSRPAVWALLPCGQRGRQFCERCRGRRAISAVLSGRIYTTGSKLIFTAMTHFVSGEKLSVTVFNFNEGDKWSADIAHLWTSEQNY